jgi:glycosyltransferase involved in cell wall biosynthesis
MLPKLSVVMPVRNAMPYLHSAIESILAQSFQNFEFVIGDDCSTDGSAECAQSFAMRDSRIRSVQSSVRLGPVGSSNWVAKEARAPLVARMDADDLCHPYRLERQMQALAEHPDAVLVGSLFNMIDRFDRPIRGVDRSALLSTTVPPIAHASILYRKWAFDEVGGYREGCDYFEELDLYQRLTKTGSLLIIADDLLSSRFAGTSARLNDDRKGVEGALDIMPSVLSARDHQRDRSGKLDPDVFRILGNLQLWSRQPPGIVLEMMRRMRLLPLRASSPVIVWAVIASLSPPLAREIARTRLAWRNWRTRRSIRSHHLYRWIPGQRSIDLGRIEPTVPK